MLVLMELLHMQADMATSEGLIVHKYISVIGNSNNTKSLPGHFMKSHVSYPLFNTV